MMQVTISFEKPAHMKSGGLAQKAQEVRDAGRHGDDILVHVNEEELNFLKDHFGPGSTNPTTGLPQFNIWDMLLPIAANVLLPGIGGTIGTALSGALGGGELVSALAPMVGNALVGGGVSALTGGDFGTGALAGGLSQPLLSALGAGGSSGVLSGLNLMGNPAVATAAKTPAAGETINAFTRGATEAAGAAQANTASSLMKAAPLLLAASALGGAGGGGQTSATPPASKADTRGLEPVEFTREQLNPNIAENYGYGPEQVFFKNNRLPLTAEEKKKMEESGVLKAAFGRYVKGGGTGTSDSIPAKLSDGEYVVDSGTVSMLGDGSSDAGAAKLDKMREEIRKHKGAALAKGKFPPDAKAPLSYIKGA
jgi:hypothetical protein